MEEDIKILEEFIEYSQGMINDMEYVRPVDVTIYQEQVTAIENLINRNEELEEENRIQRGQLNSAFDRGFIHKDKVKEKLEGKIEELFEEMDECNSYDEEDNEEKRELTDMIVLLKEVLQELLEE